MTKVAVVTDSTASIPEKIIEELNIHWVPYYIHRGKEVLRDLVTIQREAFYNWLPHAAKLPMTASPGPGDYLNIYEDLVKAGSREIISIHMTSKGSGAYQAALAAKTMIMNKLPDLKIEVIDTLNVSLCQGWMVIEAARDALNEVKYIEIIEKIKSMIPVSQMVQTADTLRYLYMGGRIGKAKHLVASLLNIKPLISMQDGEIVPLGIARNTNRAYEMMADIVEKKVGKNARLKVAYVHAAAKEEVQKIKELVDARFDCVESIIAELSPALGVHSGPGTTGICYFPVLW